MQQNELPKAIKRAMRSLVALAHEAELGRALEELYSDFQRWKAGGIDSFELSDRIHKLHEGPNRKARVRSSRSYCFPSPALATVVYAGSGHRAQTRRRLGAAERPYR